MFPHVHMLEWVFLTLVSFGTFLNVWGVASTAKDSKVMGIARRGTPLQIVTLNRLYQESFRLAIHAVMMVVAGVSISTPPPPPYYTDIPQVLTSMVGWVVVSALVTVKEILDRRERLTLDRLYDTYHGRRTDDVSLGHEGRRASDHLPPPEIVE